MFLRFLSQIQALDSYTEVFEEDDELLTGAIECDAFRMLRSYIIAADTFAQEVSDTEIYRTLRLTVHHCFTCQ